MRIYLKYGSFSHALEEASVSISRQSMLADNGVPYSITTRWDIEGTLITATQADLSTAINNLTAAYSQTGLDAQLLFDDNSQTSHTLLTANCWGGVRVVRPPSFPSSAGAEYTTYRNFAVSLEGEEIIGASGAGILKWEEEVSVKGTGGPRRTVIEVLSCYPQEQVTTTNSVVSATQRGSAVGLFFFPTAPSPLWPDAEQVSERMIAAKGPRAMGSGGNRMYREYQISWSYSFISAVPLVGGIPATQPDI